MKTNYSLALALAAGVLALAAGSYFQVGEVGDKAPAPLGTAAAGPELLPPAEEVRGGAERSALSQDAERLPLAEHEAPVSQAPAESVDFFEEAERLRASGTPEAEVERIVAARIAAHYAQKRRTIVNAPVRTAADQADRRRLLETLPKVQRAVMAQFFQEETSAVRARQTAFQRAPVGNTLTVQNAESAAAPELIPAILVPPDPEAPMTELQVAEWQNLERDFIERIGGAGQNPADPEYRRRWQDAREISDAKFRQKFGVPAFLRYNAEAGRQGETP